MYAVYFVIVAPAGPPTEVGASHEMVVVLSVGLVATGLRGSEGDNGQFVLPEPNVKIKERLLLFSAWTETE